jgi:hypothetical protein
MRGPRPLGVSPARPGVRNCSLESRRALRDPISAAGRCQDVALHVSARARVVSRVCVATSLVGRSRRPHAWSVDMAVSTCGSK